MNIDQKTGDVLNTQVNKELFSSYLYLAFADYFEDRGLRGYANYFEVQAKEELDHAMILRRYLLDNDYPVTLESVAAAKLSARDDLSVLKAALDHEKAVTKLIYDCYHVAHEARDLRSMKLLDWFIKEQGEEETNASDRVKDYENFGTDPKGLYQLDRELATRTYTQVTNADI